MSAWIRLFLEIVVAIILFALGTKAGVEVERAKSHPLKTLRQLRNPTPATTPSGTRHRLFPLRQELEIHVPPEHDADLTKLPHWPWTPEGAKPIVLVVDEQPNVPSDPPAVVPVPDAISTPPTKCVGPQCQAKASEQSVCPLGGCKPQQARWRPYLRRRGRG